VNKIRFHEMFMMEDMESSTSHSSAKKDLCWRCIFVSNFIWICKRTNPPS
jgi:hypothetical protein